MAVHAGDMCHALIDVEQMIRNKWKYGHDCETPDELIDKIREEFYDIIAERNLDLNQM